MNRISEYIKLAKWILKGKPVSPPHLIKQRLVLDSAKRNGVNILVETGTLHGDMVQAMKHHFRKIYSIEISHELAEKAQTLFKNDHNVEIIENDSAIALKTLVPQLHEPAVFWLDGHYSGGNTGRGGTDTPIMQELATILSSQVPHVVLIDDARCFGSEKDYPTIDQLESHIRTQRPNSQISIENDCIKVLPAAK